TTAERAVTHRADERDKAVVSRAAAVTGAFTIPLTGVAAVVVAVGVEPAPVFAILLWTQLAVLVVAFVRANRAMEGGPRCRSARRAKRRVSGQGRPGTTARARSTPACRTSSRRALRPARALRPSPRRRPSHSASGSGS